MQTKISIEILNYLDLSKKGIFVEAGANDGVTQSNTYLLEKNYGWSGILVEPSHEAYKKCLNNRKSTTYNCCLVSQDYQMQTIEGDFNGHLMSSVGGKRLNNNLLTKVQAFTIQSLLEKNNINQVELFSLDTEGYEYEVLKGLNFEKTNVKIFLIELYETNKNEVFELLRKKNYRDPINLSNFNLLDNPGWDGTHNDFLFIKK